MMTPSRKLLNATDATLWSQNQLQGDYDTADTTWGIFAFDYLTLILAAAFCSFQISCALVKDAYFEDT